MFNKPNLLLLFAACTIVVVGFSFRQPVANASIWDAFTNLFNFAQNGNQAVSAVSNAANQGVVSAQVEAQLKASGRWDDAQSLIDGVCGPSDSACADHIMAYYVGLDEVSNPNSSFNQSVSNAINADASLQTSLGTIGVSNNIAPSVQEIAAPSPWLQIAKIVSNVIDGTKAALNLVGHQQPNATVAQGNSSAASLPQNNPSSPPPPTLLPKVPPSVNNPLIPTPPAQSGNYDITALVVDQFDNPVSGAGFQLVDSQGKSYLPGPYFGLSTDQYGHLDVGADTSEGIPAGSYTLYINEDGYDPYKASVQISATQGYLGKITINKWPTVTIKLLNQSGSPAGETLYYAPPWNGLYASPWVPQVNIVDASGKVVQMFTCNNYGCGVGTQNQYDVTTGIYESKPLPSGHYTLTATIPSFGATPGQIILATKDFDVSYSQETFDLGSITLVGNTTNPEPPAKVVY